MLLGRHAYLGCKAALAGVLIDRAFSSYLEDGRERRPWSWADMHPVARIEVPRLGVRRTILSAASGNSLAFGLGHVSGTGRPGGSGNFVVAGHRDTWGAFLQDLRPGDEVLLETRLGRRRYRVGRLEVLRKETVEALETTGPPRLTFVTCYPFDGLMGSPWRYVVTCEDDVRQGRRSNT